MATSSEQLLVQIDATTEQLRREMRRADQTVTRSGSRIERSVSRIDQSVTRVNRSITLATRALGAFGVALSVRGLAQFATSAFSAAEAISDLSAQTGIGTDTIQSFRIAADQAGSSTGTADDALQRFGRRMGLFAAGQGGAASAAFERFNIAVRDSNGAMRSTEDTFRDAIDAISQITSESEQAAAASQFFGDRAGPQLVSAIRQGTAGLDEMTARLRETGRLFEQDIIARAAEASAGLRDLQTQASQTIQISFLEQLASQMGDLRDISTDPAFQSGLSGIGTVLGLIASEAASGVRQIGQLVEALRQLDTLSSWQRLMDQGRIDRQVADIAGRVIDAFGPSEAEQEINRLEREIESLRTSSELLFGSLQTGVITQTEFNEAIEENNAAIAEAEQRIAALAEAQNAATTETERTARSMDDLSDSTASTSTALQQYIDTNEAMLNGLGRSSHELLRQMEGFDSASQSQRNYAEGLASFLESQRAASSETQQLTEMLEAMRVEGLTPQQRALEIVNTSIEDMNARLRSAQEAVHHLTIREMEFAAAAEQAARAELAASYAFAAGAASRQQVEEASNRAAEATLRHAGALAVLEAAQRSLDNLSGEFDDIWNRRQELEDRLAQGFTVGSSGGSGASVVDTRMAELEREREAAERSLEDITRLFQRHTETRLETVQRETRERMSHLDQLRDQSIITEEEHSQARIELITATSAQIREIQEREAQEGARAQIQAQRQVEFAIESSMRAISSGLTNSLYESENAWESFGNTAVNVLQRIHEQVMELVVIAPLMNSLFGGNRTTIGDVGGIFGSMFGGGGTPAGAGHWAVTAHTGGVPGTDSLPGRSVPSGVFAGAQRFHSGLMPDEFPAILQKGEGVFTRGQMAAMGGGNVTVNVINQGGEPLQVESQRQRVGAGGSKQIEVFVRQMVQKDMGNGAFDEQLGRRFGLNRVGHR